MATIRYYDSAGKELKKYAATCCRINVIGKSGAQYIRQQFTPQRQGQVWRENAEVLYSRLLSEKTGLADSQAEALGAMQKTLRTQTFSWLADKYVTEHLLEHTNSGDNQSWIKILKHHFGTIRLCWLSGPMVRKLLWEALNGEIDTPWGKSKYEASSIDHIAQYAVKVYNWGVREKIIPSNPLKAFLSEDKLLCDEIRIRQSETQDRKAVVLTAEEFWSFMAWPRLRRDIRRAAIIAYASGMRRGEICKLTWNRIKCEPRGWYITWGAHDVKEKKSKRVWVDQEGVEILTEIQVEQIADGTYKEDGHVIITKQGRPLSPDACSHAWDKARLNFVKYCKNSRFAKANFHKLRNTYRVRKGQETDDVHAIARNMGHSDLTMSVKYDTVDDGRLARMSGFANSNLEILTKPLSDVLKLAAEHGIPVEEIHATLRQMFRDKVRADCNKNQPATKGDYNILQYSETTTNKKGLEGLVSSP